MECALFFCPRIWEGWLPAGVCPLRDPEGVAGRCWDLLALTPRGCHLLGQEPVCCRELLVPGNFQPALLRNIETQTVVTYGLSIKDSLTFSSLAEPVLCLQRSLPRPDGGWVEPQEFPLPPLPYPAETLLPLLGLRLLGMPLSDCFLLQGDRAQPAADDGKVELKSGENCGGFLTNG